jgi:hypothetical protein
MNGVIGDPLLAETVERVLEVFSPDVDTKVLELDEPGSFTS